MWCPVMCGSGSESSRVRSSNIIRSAGTECRVHLDSVSRCRQALQGRRAERIAAGRVRPTPLRGRGRLRFFQLFDLEELDGGDHAT